MRDGRIGLAPVQAVLSFLRQDGAMYEPVVERAGRLTAEWWLGGTLAVRRRAATTGPVWIRGRVAMGLSAMRVSAHTLETLTSIARRHNGECF